MTSNSKEIVQLLTTSTSASEASDPVDRRIYNRHMRFARQTGGSAACKANIQVSLLDSPTADADWSDYATLSAPASVNEFLIVTPAYFPFVRIKRDGTAGTLDVWIRSERENSPN